MPPPAPGPPKLLHFYLDLVSPYSYLAFLRTRDRVIPSRPELRVAFRPVVFGAVLKHHGHLGTGEIPDKRSWMLRDLARTADGMGIGMGWPKVHPFVSLHALRLCSLPPGDPRQLPLLSLFFDAAFGASNFLKHDLSKEDCDALLSAAIADGRVPADVAREPTAEMKDRLRASTNEAIKYGVFGVPAFRAEGSEEVAWGNDALDGVIARLCGERRDALQDEGWREWVAKVEPVKGVVRSR
ncbi:DSBA-like thioredoxin domain-containing protein [Hyaloraphidium curvatum]|nr:DSBA-like thioredoxin domain-containing protein [Hyaloraphidium curvatum]